MLGLLCCLPPPLHAALSLTTKGDLSIEDEKDDRFWFELSGYFIHIDTAFSGSQYDRQGDFPNGALNITYLDIDGGLGKNWSYYGELNYKPIDTIEIPWLYLEYTGFKNAKIDVGEIAIPNGFENWMYVKDLLFVAPSLLSGAFFPFNDAGLGIMVKKTFADKFTLNVAGYQPHQLLLNFGDPGRSDRPAEACRLTYSPVHTKTKFYHLGVWARHQSLNYAIAGAPIPLDLTYEGFFDTPEQDGRNTASLVNTGPFRASCYILSGIEAATMCGPWLLMSEYLHADVYRKFTITNAPLLKSHVKFKSFYIQSAYVLTGESHEYEFDEGSIENVVPKNCWGAFEVALRYSTISLTDQDVLGGKEHNITFGVNWYLNEKIKVQGNYTHASAIPTSIANPGTALFPRRRLNIYALKFQVIF